MDLQRRGFEIGFHGATPATSERDVVIAATNRFREILGHDPRTFANHSGCLESIYWGSASVTGIHRLAYNLMTGFRRTNAFRGHVAGDPLFWGDIMPYSEGADVAAVNRSLTEDAQDLLEDAESACIVYSHFASGFFRDGQLEERFRVLMTCLAAKEGRFVPVTTLLDRLDAQRGDTPITRGEHRAWERRWLRSKAHVGPT